MSTQAFSSYLLALGVRVYVALDVKLEGNETQRIVCKYQGNASGVRCVKICIGNPFFVGVESIRGNLDRLPTRH